MTRFPVIIALAALGGCAAPPPGPAYYGTRMGPVDDPHQWHVVSVTPVAPGTGAQLASSGNGSSVQYSSAPVTVTEPVYVAQPIFVPQPVYVPEPYYYYPPVSIGLGFNFGHSWGGHHRGWGGARFGGHRHR
jgi:hypothetical protein